MSTSSILPTASLGGASGTSHRPADLRARFKRAGLAVWHALEASGHARAMRELRALHGHWEISDPELARELREGHAFLRSQSDRRRG